MSVLIQSFSLVTLAEMGDKTQLLSIILAARYRKFFPIITGIFVATLANHAFVAWAGSELQQFLSPAMLTPIVSLLFIAVGLWTLIPDKSPDHCDISPHGAFFASCLAFFIAEMGDKTQLATLTLGAQHPETLQVILGTTLGMLAANIPAVLFGEAVLKKIPLNVVRITACILFIGFGIVGLVRWLN